MSKKLLVEYENIKKDSPEYKFFEKKVVSEAEAMKYKDILPCALDQSNCEQHKKVVVLQIRIPIHLFVKMVDQRIKEGYGTNAEFVKQSIREKTK